MNQIIRNRQQHRGFRAGIRRDPVVGMRGGVRKTRVEDDQLRAVGFAVDDALRVWIEVMARLEMRADQQDDFGVCVIGTGTIETHPELITFAAAGRANVGVRVVTVNAPGGEDAFGETIFTGPPDVIHDLVATIFDDRFANSRGDVVERFVPGGAFPFSFAAFAGALERIKNAIGIVNLIERCRTFGAVASARARDARDCLQTSAPRR